MIRRNNSNFTYFFNKINRIYSEFNEKDKQKYNPKLIKSNILILKKICNKFFEKCNFMNNLSKYDNSNIDFISNDKILIILPFIDNCIIIPSNEYLKFISNILMKNHNKKNCTILTVRMIRFPNRVSYLKDNSSVYKHEWIENNHFSYIKILDFQLLNFNSDCDYFNKINDFMNYLKNSKNKKHLKNDLMDIGFKNTNINKNLIKNFGNEYNDWVSPSNIRNFILNDPILDWFKYYGEKNGFVPDNILKESYDYFNFIINRGIKFEEYIYNILKKKYGTDIVNIQSEDKYFSLNNVEKTKKCMRDKKPIIYQANLLSYEKKIYGIVDLLIRKDFLKKEFNIPTIDLEGDNYVVVDIKFSTLYENKNGCIANRGSCKCYKSQIIMYTDMLNEMQNSNEQYCFLMGRRYLNKNKEVLDGKTNLGVLNILNEDILKSKIDRSIEWIKWLRTEGDKYHPLKNIIPNLMPNMCNKLDYPWHKMKKNISFNQSEITLLWNCGIKQRNESLKKNVNNFRDPKFNPELSDCKKVIVNKMIKKNKKRKLSDSDLEISSCKKFKTERNTMYFYVDFEFLNTCDITFSHNTRTHLYMIGCGYIKDNEWKYNVFITNTISIFDEKYIIKSWVTKMNRIKEENSMDNIKLIHWSHAEPSLFKKLSSKYNINYNFEWIDLLNYYKNIPIIQKSVFDFNLKNVAKKLKESNIINTVWNSSVIDGLGATVAVVQGLKKSKNLNKIPEMEEIIKYNEIDCKVLYEMKNYIN